MHPPGDIPLPPPRTAPPVPGHRDRAVLIVEHSDDVGRAVSILRQGEADVRIVAASPGVSWELDCLSVPHRFLESFADPAALHRVGMENYPVTELLCRAIDEHVGRLIPEYGDLGLHPGGDNFFFIKVLLDALSLRIAMLTSLIDRVSPDLLLATGFRPGGSRLPRRITPFDPGERLIPSLLSLEGWGCRTSVLLPDGEEQQDAPSLPHPQKGIIRGWGRESGAALFGSLGLVARERSLRGKAGLAAALARNALRPRKSLVLAGYGYDWYQLAPRLILEGCSLKFLRDETAHGPSTGRAGAIPEPPLAEYCQKDGIDFSSLFWDRLEPLLSDYLAQAPTRAGRLERELSGLKPLAVLCGPRSEYAGRIHLGMATKPRVPVLTWQHGAGGFFPWKMQEYTELDGSDLHLCFGQGVAEGIGGTARERYGCRVVPTGSLDLEQMREAFSGLEEPDAILYATTNYYRNDLYVSGPVLFSDEALWRCQQQILAVLGATGRKVLFKIHPSNYENAHLGDFIRRNGFGNISLVGREVAFPDLLRRSGAVVVDIPTTTVLQAAATERPLFVFTGLLPLHAGGEELLRKRAFLSGNLGEFCMLVGRYFRGEPPGQIPDVHDTCFLEEYGIHRADGKVGDRALAVIRGLEQELPAGQ